MLSYPESGRANSPRLVVRRTFTSTRRATDSVRLPTTIKNANVKTTNASTAAVLRNLPDNDVVVVDVRNKPEEIKEASVPATTKRLPYSVKHMRGKHGNCRETQLRNSQMSVQIAVTERRTRRVWQKLATLPESRRECCVMNIRRVHNYPNVHFKHSTCKPRDNDYIIEPPKFTVFVPQCSVGNTLQQINTGYNVSSLVKISHDTDVGNEKCVIIPHIISFDKHIVPIVKVLEPSADEYSLYTIDVYNQTGNSGTVHVYLLAFRTTDFENCTGLVGERVEYDKFNVPTLDAEKAAPLSKFISNTSILAHDFFTRSTESSPRAYKIKNNLEFTAVPKDCRFLRNSSVKIQNTTCAAIFTSDESKSATISVPLRIIDTDNVFNFWNKMFAVRKNNKSELHYDYCAFLDSRIVLYSETTNVVDKPTQQNTCSAIGTALTESMQSLRMQQPQKRRRLSPTVRDSPTPRQLVAQFPIQSNERSSRLDDSQTSITVESDVKKTDTLANRRKRQHVERSSQRIASLMKSKRFSSKV